METWRIIYKQVTGEDSTKDNISKEQAMELIRSIARVGSDNDDKQSIEEKIGNKDKEQKSKSFLEVLKEFAVDRLGNDIFHSTFKCEDLIVNFHYYAHPFGFISMIKPYVLQNKSNEFIKQIKSNTAGKICVRKINRDDLPNCATNIVSRYYLFLLENILRNDSEDEQWGELIGIKKFVNKSTSYSKPFEGKGPRNTENNSFSALDWSKNFDDFDADSWELHYNPYSPY